MRATTLLNTTLDLPGVWADDVNAGPGDLPGSAIDRLASQATDLAAELLPDGDTWELDAATIRRWLTDRGVIRTLEDRWPPGSRA